MGKWDSLLKGLEHEDYLKTISGAMMSNMAKALSSNTNNVNVGPFAKFAFPLVRKAYPQLVSSQLVSVQPMTSPVGGIFYYQPYGSYSNPMKVGDSVQTTRKINKQIITGVVQKIVQGRRGGIKMNLAVVENAKTGKTHRIAPSDLRKVTPLDVLATVD